MILLAISFNDADDDGDGSVNVDTRPYYFQVNTADLMLRCFVSLKRNELVVNDNSMVLTTVVFRSGSSSHLFLLGSCAYYFLQGAVISQSTSTD